MSPPALAATRAIAVLDFFTANPRRAFTLSELSAAVEINFASLSSVLRSLTDAGYLVRHPRHKTYELGPALVAVGQAAMQRHPVVELARPEMRRLAKLTGTECVGTALVGNEIMMLALEGRPLPRTRGLSLGLRIPLVPPLGQVFLAWSSAATVESWIARGLGDRPAPPDRAHLLDTLEQVRRRGYAVNLSTAQINNLRATVDELTQRPHDPGLRARMAEAACSLGSDYELMDEEPDATYDVEMISAPIFGAEPWATFCLTLTGLSQLTGRDVIRIGEQVAAAGLMITRQIDGRVPGPDTFRNSA